MKDFVKNKLSKMSEKRQKEILKNAEKLINDSSIFNLSETLIEVFKVSKKERKSLTLQLVKLAEEHGELAAGVLMHLGQKGSDMSKSEIKENVLEESCDCLLMILSILNKAGFNINEINDMVKKKLEKWENKLGY